MSYMRQIEERAVYFNSQSYSRTVGRLKIDALCAESNRWDRIGTEVYLKSLRNGSQDYTDNCSTDWIFRSYVDGTAYLYPNRLNMFNWTTVNKIRKMIKKHFHVVKEERHDCEYGDEEFQILKRKPCNALSKRFVIKTRTFGEFLTTKYNTEVADEVL